MVGDVMYCPPYSVANAVFLRFSVATGSAKLLTYPGLDSGSELFAGAVAVPSGNVYAIPYKATFMAEIVPGSDTAEINRIDVPSGHEWFGGVLFHDYVVGVPHSSGSSVLVFNWKTKNSDLLPVIGVPTLPQRWRGAVYSRVQDRVLFTPAAVTQVGVVYLSPTGTVTFALGTNLGVYDTSAEAWGTMVEASNGFVYVLPRTANVTVCLNTMNQMVTSVVPPDTRAVHKWVSAVRTPAGRVVAVAYTDAAPHSILEGSFT